MQENSFYTDKDMTSENHSDIIDRFGILKQKLKCFDLFCSFLSCQTNFPVYSAPFKLKWSLVKPTQLKIYGRGYFVRKNPPTDWTAISFVADYKAGNA